MNMLVRAFVVMAVAAGCEADLRTKTSLATSLPEVPERTIAEEGEQTAESGKFTLNCLDPDLSKVSNQVTLTLCNGELGRGELDLTNLVPENIKSGITIAGQTGAYPSATYPLTGSTSTPDLDLATFNAKIKSTSSFEWFSPEGVRYVNAGDAGIQAGFILSNVSIFGTAGTYTPFSVATFNAVQGAGKIALSWTATGAGIIVMRRAGAPVTWVPTNGMTYTAGSAVDANHTVIYAGTASSFDYNSVVDGTTYHFKAFAYNSDTNYSAASTPGSLTYVDYEVCGGTGDFCYDDAAAIADGIATTPTGKVIEYVLAGGSFYIWKEVGGNRALKPDGSDNWALNLNLNGKGFTSTPFTFYKQVAGRRCPPNVYIDDTNKFTTGNCLYYTAETAAQALSIAGSSQSSAGSIGLTSWNGYNGGNPRWYVGNIETCALIGMRLPTIFETTTTDQTQTYYPTADGNPTFALTAGVPSMGSETWTASANTNVNTGFWTWSGTALTYHTVGFAYQVRCVLP